MIDGAEGISGWVPAADFGEAATTASKPPDQRLKTEVIVGALLLEIKVADDATNLRQVSATAGLPARLRLAQCSGRTCTYVGIAAPV